MLGSYTYWVFDPELKQFGPNKFVGFCNMTIPKYALSQRMQTIELLHGHFNGTKARRAIQAATGSTYAQHPDSHAGVDAWAAVVSGVPERLRNVKRTKLLTLTNSVVSLKTPHCGARIGRFQGCCHRNSPKIGEYSPLRCSNHRKRQNQQN